MLTSSKRLDQLEELLSKAVKEGRFLLAKLQDREDRWEILDQFGNEFLRRYVKVRRVTARIMRRIGGYDDVAE